MPEQKASTHFAAIKIGQEFADPYSGHRYIKTADNLAVPVYLMDIWETGGEGLHDYFDGNEQVEIRNDQNDETPTA